jgi:DNA-binding Lrp family transcriptional regulator
MQNIGEIVYPHAMATAHVIIKCRSGLEDRVIEHLEKINEIKSVHRTIGEFDVLAKVEATDYESLRKIIRWKIFTADYIESVTTLMCMRKSMCAVVE